MLPASLNLDLANPRIPDESFDTEDAVIEYLVDHADIDELIQSILSSGWLDYEPLIVLRTGNIVLEGNRRLAALRIIESKKLQETFKINIPHDHVLLPATVRIRYVDSRSEARDFIGFKHINGAFKWDALAKAKYAADWFREGGDIDKISRRLGDNHNTVSRLVNGWNVLQQSTACGFSRENTTKKSFPFSHLYTALARPNVRRYLGLQTDDITVVLPQNPVDGPHTGKLLNLMSWLYGQKNEPAVVLSQNPDLNKLVDVLGKQTALEMLEGTRDLNAAYEQTTDKAIQFSTALMQSIKQVEEAAKLVSHYDGRPDLLAAADALRRTMSILHGTMKNIRNITVHGAESDADQ